MEENDWVGQWGIDGVTPVLSLGRVRQLPHVSDSEGLGADKLCVLHSAAFRYGGVVAFSCQSHWLLFGETWEISHLVFCLRQKNVLSYPWGWVQRSFMILSRFRTALMYCVTLNCLSTVQEIAESRNTFHF